VLADGDIVVHRHSIRHHVTRARRDYANPLEKQLQETLAARTIRCDQIDATPRPLGAVDGSVSAPVT